MAFGHGKNARFLIDNSTGGLTDISTGMTDVDFPQTADTRSPAYQAQRW